MYLSLCSSPAPCVPPPVIAKASRGAHDASGDGFHPAEAVHARRARGRRSGLAVRSGGRPGAAAVAQVRQQLLFLGSWPPCLMIYVSCFLDLLFAQERYSRRAPRGDVVCHRVSSRRVSYVRFMWFLDLLLARERYVVSAHREILVSSSAHEGGDQKPKPRHGRTVAMN